MVEKQAACWAWAGAWANAMTKANARCLCMGLWWVGAGPGGRGWASMAPPPVVVGALLLFLKVGYLNQSQ